mmetsp:Transcript_18729/g.52352  ORF Transcript_18729/g.52352 Transcript_18729/m.52352 type:complete len:213 (-) Transcript_18729:1467-2105(-)
MIISLLEFYSRQVAPVVVQGWMSRGGMEVLLDNHAPGRMTGLSGLQKQFEQRVSEGIRANFIVFVQIAFSVCFNEGRIVKDWVEIAPKMDRVPQHVRHLQRSQAEHLVLRGRGGNVPQNHLQNISGVDVQIQKGRVKGGQVKEQSRIVDQVAVVGSVVHKLNRLGGIGPNHGRVFLDNRAARVLLLVGGEFRIEDFWVVNIGPVVVAHVIHL